MKRIICLILIVTAMATVNARTKKYLLEVGDFSELKVSSGINVDYKYMPDSAGYAIYACSDEAARAITFSNNKKRLKIEVDRELAEDVALPTICVYSSAITKVVNEGDSLVRVLTSDPSEVLSIKVIGNGHLMADGVYTSKLSAAVEAGRGSLCVSGQAQEAKYTIASVGSLNAIDTNVNRATCNMFGTGEIDLSVSDALTLYGAGSGTVKYKGSPQIKKRAVGVKLEQVK